jgi:hypothetical protein
MTYYLLLLLAITVGGVVAGLLFDRQYPGVIGETLDKIKVRLTPKPPMPRSDRIRMLKQKVLESEARVRDLEAVNKKRKEEQTEELALKRQLIVTQNKANALSRRRR